MVLVGNHCGRRDRPDLVAGSSQKVTVLLEQRLIIFPVFFKEKKSFYYGGHSLAAKLQDVALPSAVRLRLVAPEIINFFIARLPRI